MLEALVTRVRRVVAEIGVETVLTVAFLAQVVSSGDVPTAHAARVAYFMDESVVVLTGDGDEARVEREMAREGVAVRVTTSSIVRADAQSHRVRRVARPALPALPRAVADSVVRVMVVAPDGRVQTRRMLVRRFAH